MIPISMVYGPYNSNTCDNQTDGTSRGKIVHALKAEMQQENQDESQLLYPQLVGGSTVCSIKNFMATRMRKHTCK